jgi:hypothetical protein
LNKELLPLLGLPTNAMLNVFVKILDAKVMAIYGLCLRNWKQGLGERFYGPKIYSINPGDGG